MERVQLGAHKGKPLPWESGALRYRAKRGPHADAQEPHSLLVNDPRAEVEFRRYSSRHVEQMAGQLNRRNDGALQESPGPRLSPMLPSYMKLLTVTRRLSPAFEGANPNTDKLALHRAQAGPAIPRIGRHT